MTSTGQEQGCPAEVLAAIPWYPEDLSLEERGAVDAHAASCLDCRRELEARLADLDDQAGWPMPDPDRVFMRVLARVELDEADSLREWARAPRGRRAVRWLREREVHLPGLATPVSVSRGLSAAASFGVLIAAAALFFGTSPDSTESRKAQPDVPRIDVVFREDLTAGGMATALAGIEGEIVSGPTSRGRYQVALPEGSNPEAAAQTLSDAGVVIYAEPSED